MKEADDVTPKANCPKTHFEPPPIGYPKDTATKREKTHPGQSSTIVQNFTPIGRRYMPLLKEYIFLI